MPAEENENYYYDEEEDKGYHEELEEDLGDVGEFAKEAGKKGAKVYGEREAIRRGARAGRYFYRAARKGRLGRAFKLYRAFAKRAAAEEAASGAVAVAGGGASASVGVWIAVIIILLIIFIFFGVILLSFKDYATGGGEFVTAGPEAPQSAFLSVTKETESESISNPREEGAQIPFTLEFTNTSGEPLKNVRISDSRAPDLDCAVPEAGLDPGQTVNCSYFIDITSEDADSLLTNDVEIIATTMAGEEIVSYASSRVAIGSPPEGTAPCGSPVLNTPASALRITQGCRSAHATTSDPGEGNATDIGLASGTELRAVIDGTARRCVQTTGYGVNVLLQGVEYTVRYAHLMREEGDVNGQCTSFEVRKGDRIALSGNTGNSTGPHLHYEIKRGGALLCPTNHEGGSFIGGNAAACQETVTEEPGSPGEDPEIPL